MVGQRRISLTDPSEHPPLSKVPSPQLGIYRGNQSGHFIHTTGIESLPIVIGNSVALDSPDLLSKHTSDCNSNNNSNNNNSSNSNSSSNNNSSSGSSSNSRSGIVSTCQRPSRLRGKTVLLKHLEIDERFYYRSSPSAMNIDGEGSRNENTKNFLSSSKSDYDGSARRLSSMESEKENGRSPPLPLRNFERRAVTEEHRSRVRFYEADGVDKKAAAKTFSTLRSQSLEHLTNESSGAVVDSIGSVFRCKLSLSPTASELHERKEVDNRGLTNIMSRLKCDINPPTSAFGMDANVFRRTSSDTIVSSNSEVKDSKLTDYSVEKKNSKEKENKPHDSLLYRKRIMKPSPPLTHPPKPKDYVASKMDLLHSQSSTPVGDLSLHPAAVSFIESKTIFFYYIQILFFSFLSSNFCLFFIFQSHSRIRICFDRHNLHIYLLRSSDSAPVAPFVKNGRTYRSASLPHDEPQSLSPGIGRLRTTSSQYESKIAHRDRERDRDRERKENNSIVSESLVHVRNIAKMNGSVVRAREQYDAGQKPRYPSSTITSTASASASVNADHVGQLHVLNRSAHYRRNNTVTSNRGDVCDLTRYPTGCENHTPSEDDFGMTIRESVDTYNYDSNSNDDDSNDNSNNCSSSYKSSDNNSSFNGNSYVPRRVRISTAAVSKTYSRTKNPRKKKRGLSYYIIRGASLDAIPEHRELVEFSEYVQIKSKRFSNSVSDTLKQQLKGR